MVNKTDSAKTYSKKNPVLVQKVLTFNKEGGKSPLKSPQKVKEEEQVVKEEVEEKEAIPPWGRCLASGPDCPVHSAILPRTHWAFYSSVQEVIFQLIFQNLCLVLFHLVKVRAAPFYLRSICLLTVSTHGVTEKEN